MRKRIPDAIQNKVWQEAGGRCGYCLSKQELVYDILQIDHIIPLAKGGTNDETNLWLLCASCNRAKSDKTEVFDKETNVTVPLFHPRLHNWYEHFSWAEDGTHITGITAIGRATVSALNLNKERLIIVRRNWVAVGWHPPKN